jgi:immunoglobulin-like protein involved in spore germination
VPHATPRRRSGLQADGALIRRLASILTGAVAAAALAGCGGGSRSAGAVCANGDGALDKTAFVFVEAPRSGERVLNGFRVMGCSSTFEANVNWRLRGRDGHVLTSGFTEGGSLEPGSFEFTVSYPIGARQVGHLEVYEPQVTTEGFPPVKNVLPLVLEP